VDAARDDDLDCFDFHSAISPSSHLAAYLEGFRRIGVVFGGRQSIPSPATRRRLRVASMLPDSSTSSMRSSRLVPAVPWMRVPFWTNAAGFEAATWFAPWRPSIGGDYPRVRPRVIVVFRRARRIRIDAPPSRREDHGDRRTSRSRTMRGHLCSIVVASLWRS
jgi:hypothetical protein